MYYYRCVYKCIPFGKPSSASDIFRSEIGIYNDNVMVMAVLLVYDCHQTTRKVHAPGVAVTCGVMGGLFIVGCTAWYVDGVGLSMNKEVKGVDFSVYGTGYICNK